MMKERRVKLTLPQADQVSWALDPMVDFWCTEDEAHARGGPVYTPESLPKLIDHVSSASGRVMQSSKLLVLSRVDDINADLLYRLEEQLQDMAEEHMRGSSATEFAKERGASKAALNAAARIRNRLNLA